MKPFVHLHVHSHYSLLDGLAKIEDLVSKAKELGAPALALTDHGNLYGAVEFYRKATAAEIKPILGVEAYLAPNGRHQKRSGVDNQRYHLTLLAKNNQGWKNIIKMITLANLEGFYYKPRMDWELLQEYHEGVICLSGCISGELSKLVETGKTQEAEETAARYKKLFGDDYYLEIQPHTPEVHEGVIAISKKLNIPLVATQDIHYVNKEDKNAHEILLAVQTRNIVGNDERMSLKDVDIYMRSGEKMAELFKDTPEAIENTLRIAEKCNVEMELGVDKIPHFPVPDGYTSQSYLEELAYDRIAKKYPNNIEGARERAEHELSVIKKTGYADYFLIVRDIIKWAKQHGIVVGPGRGSAAGSIVSYLLGITNVDPIKYDLLFERFLNPDRVQVPDIDIDFADTRRDEVIAYVRQRYGEDKVAQIITFGTMAARAAIRDTGRALGLSYGFCDRLAKLIPFNASIDKAFEEVPELKEAYKSDPQTKELIDAAKKLEGVVRHASVHACGVVISPVPLTDFMPLQRAPQGESAVITQFEMHSVEALGLLKMDFLGLRNLSIIQNTLQLIKEQHGEDINISKLPLDDEQTFELFQQGATTGVFQLESSGMRRYLKQLVPNELEDIIAMLSLYRPGPMDLIPHYIKRKFGEEEVEFLHPKLEPILASTYGVGIYQEQMMRIARDLAGFSLAEADILRKAIGKKIEKLLQEQKEKLLKGMKENGIDDRTAQQVWNLFPPFARYGFNRSHSTSYAMISFQTAYLKAHYPIEFVTSLLNTAGDTDRINFLVSEARQLNIDVLPPDINVSYRDFTIDEDRDSIRFGLAAIKNIGLHIVDAIIEERAQGGPYESLEDFLSRVQDKDLNKKSLESLSKAGALDSLDVSRSQMLANLDELVRFNQASKKLSLSDQGDLFAGNHKPTLQLKENGEISKRDILNWEKELLGLYLTEHPFSRFSKYLSGNIKPIKDIRHNDHNGYSSYCSVAGIISSIKRIFTKNGQPMLFVTIEDDSDHMEVLVFNDTLQKSQSVWVENNPIIVKGRLSARDDEPKIICNQVKKIA